MADNIRQTSVRGLDLALAPDRGLIRHEPFQALSTATGSVIHSRGMTTLSSAAASYTIDGPPRAGVVKRISTLTSSTLVRAVIRSSTALYFQSTDGSTMVRINMASPGSCVELIGASTSLWLLVNRTSTDTTFTGTS